jgi:hypothetical protein
MKLSAELAAEQKRREHILKLVDGFIAGNSHPAMMDMMELALDRKLKVQTCRTVAASRSFGSIATTLTDNTIITERLLYRH